MKSNFLILITFVHGNRFDIEFINRFSVYGSYYYSTEYKILNKYLKLNCSEIPDNAVIAIIKNKKLYYGA